ncbi:MAG: hypothetical protein DA407_03345 [Bacteroidetes bacterium]|nr:MAG: hypothetical protein DA407_03345 [Bacteroidota bacterium]
MIKLFRHIRKSLLMENKTSKYFKYAIGEIILVVIGILIALQINTWNQGRLSKKMEHNYINRLIEDLVSDTTMISNQIRQSKIRFEYGTALDSMIRIGNRRQISAVEVIEASQNIGRLWLPQYNANTYNDLINTGNFSIISDPVIADYIRGHYTGLPYSWNDIFDQRMEELRRIMVELIPLKFHVAVIAPESMPEIPKPETVLSEEEANAIVENMMAYPKIDFYVKNVTRGHIFHIGLMEDVKKATTELINDLKKY